jgi:hypothetical protein
LNCKDLSLTKESVNLHKKSFMRSTVGLSAQCYKVYYSAIVTKLVRLSTTDITFLV